MRGVKAGMLAVKTLGTMDNKREGTPKVGNEV